MDKLNQVINVNFCLNLIRMFGVGLCRSEDLGAEAKLHLTQGKRKMLVQDYVMAVESLQKACELLAAKYGDDASESAEALHYYGKALLELHRKESGALNDMETPGAADDDSSDEEDAEEKEEGDEEDNEKKVIEINQKMKSFVDKENSESIY